MTIARKTTEVKFLQKGPQGNKGAKLRMRDWKEGEEFLAGAEGEAYYDIVNYFDKLYLTIVSHTAKSGVNDPITSVSQQKGFWELAQDWTFIATKLLLADKINSEQIDVDSLKVKHLDGADGTFTGKLVAASGSFTGSLLTNSDGKRILINPNTRSIQLILKDNSVISEWAFYELNGYQSCSFTLFNNGSESLIMYPHAMQLNRGSNMQLNMGPDALTLVNGIYSISIRANQITMFDGNNYTGYTGTAEYVPPSGYSKKLYFKNGILYKIE